jgi:tetratricopeptide (TPR) repeat protein
MTLATRRLFAFLFLCSAVLAADDSLRNAGIAAFKAGRYSTALNSLEKSGSADPVTRAFIGLSKAGTGDCAGALPILLSVRDVQVEKLAKLAAAKCYGNLNQTDKAFPILDDLAHRFPKDADVLYLQAKLHMKAFNDATYAMFQKTPGSYRVHELSAEIFEVQSRYADAVGEYEKAIEINPSASDLHFRLGRALLLESHDPASLQKASQAFEAELKLNPEDGACEFQLGQIAQVQGDKQEARKRMMRALELSPDFVQALITLGKLDTQEKNYDSAIARLKRAITLQPANETAHYALLTAYRDSGDMQKAKDEKAILDRLQKPPEGEFTDFLKKLGEAPKQ